MPPLKPRWWRPVSNYTERELQAFLFDGGGNASLFLEPRGEPGLIPADGVTAQVYSVPLTVYIGGITAVILELAEPRVRHGVWDHSIFPTDPVLRLKRTGLAAMVTFYGAASVARQMIAEVNKKHAGVGGVTDGGAPYAALDQELLHWVHGTAAFGFITAYSTYVRPLNGAEWDMALREAQPAARFYGVLDPPENKAQLDALIADTLSDLEASTTLTEFLTIMETTPTLPSLGRWLQPLFVRAAIDLVPPEVREVIGLGHHRLSGTERILVSALVRGSTRLNLRNHPRALAAQRMA
ncbi:MAG: oxygenase MpaB family protein [Pseudomonadota bacterium]